MRILEETALSRPCIPFGAVPRHLVGDNGPSVRPADDSEALGKATLSPTDPVEVRTFNTFELVYTVGRLGLDDTGGIRVAFRSISDSGKPQLTDPSAPNFVTATSSGNVGIVLKYDKFGGQRPWGEVLTAYASGGYLNPGDTITITFGDTKHGSPGMLAQTFVEGGREFRVMADVQATGNFLELPDTQLYVPVVAGPADAWFAVLPTLRPVGAPFFLGLKAEDRWGNPTDLANGTELTLRPSLPVNGLPASLIYAPEDRALTLENLSVDQPGELSIDILIGGEVVATAGPLVIGETSLSHYWGDLHGQTGETIGTNTLESYLDFARNKAFLDVTSHQANDFQINAAFWSHLNTTTAAWNEPGRFTVFPGYEWSGNTAVGGDHNVFFAEEGQIIRRCSHALLEDRTEMGNDCNTLTDLYQGFRDGGEDVVLYAHVGGRYANIHYDHDPKLETAVEMHSAWGTFEWILTDGFPLGRRVGVVCNSDGHKGRPGASYPGDSYFGAYGGLTCFLTEKNNRASIMEAQRRRHHYGTTGCRMFIDLRADLPEDGLLFHRNPQADPGAATEFVRRAIMGDIVETPSAHADLEIDVRAHTGIASIEVRNGSEVQTVLRPYSEADLGNRIRVLWAGAEYRGRDRAVDWVGRAKFEGAALKRTNTINQWNPDQFFEQRGSNMMVWNSVTTGNFMGFDAWISGDAGQLLVTTNQGNLRLELDAIGLDPVVQDCGGLGKLISAQRLPDAGLASRISGTCRLALKPEGDNPIWICVTTEDGFQAWTSPIYLTRNARTQSVSRNT